MTTVLLQGQSQPQTNREYVFEDPLAPLRLPPLAQISEFWRRYDRLADIHDKKLTTNLNGNLDVLLIFAALFSAINTTFITITMPDLSPNPSDETNNLLRLLVMRADNNTLAPSDLVRPFSPNSNSIVVNCLLYASLSCSLLAAVGAMMAKEWLQSFDRTGQTGPLEEQARFRQRKFDGVLEWHLEAVIKFLPNLLLLSVIFFFVGVCLFLFPINTAVAGIVVAFSGIGVVFSGIVIVAGALSPTCPYQSAASSALRRGSWALVQSWKLARRALISPTANRTSEAVQKLWMKFRPWIVSLMARAMVVAPEARPRHDRPSGLDDSGSQQAMNQYPLPLPLVLSDSGSSILSILDRNPTAKADSDQVLTIQATRWLLETTSNRGDQISSAQFICSLDRATCAAIFEDEDSWKGLLNLTLGAFEIWHSQPNKENQEVVELFGLMLCRVLAQSPEESDKWKGITEESGQGSNRFGKTFWKTLVLACRKYASSTLDSDQSILQLAVIHTALQARLDITQFLLSSGGWGS